MAGITEETLQDFLERLGQCYRHPGRIFLVGGSSLILVDAKVTTLDIDLKLEIPDQYQEEFIRCLREISLQRNLSVELASPDQFIPLPAGYQNRHQYIGRYGSLELFHFDFYSMALSKLHRGNQKDYSDVIQMVRNDLISMAELRKQFQEVLPKLKLHDISRDVEDFEYNFRTFEQLLNQT